MSRRSVTNDRYRVERSGKSRKSASSAKPKRAAGESASAPAKKKPAAKRSLWGRAQSREPVPAIKATPEMTRLRRWWFLCIGIAVAVAFVVWIVKPGDQRISAALLGLYAASLAGAFYIEFGPLKRARIAAVAAAKKGGKAAKSAAAKETAPVPPAAVNPTAGIGGFFSGLFGGKKGGDGKGEGGEGEGGA